MNGKFTLGENIGDLSGVTISYAAYKASLNGKTSPVIHGFTGEQRFFLGFAQVWRCKYRDEELKNRLTVDPHSPAECRERHATKRRGLLHGVRRAGRR